MTQVTTRSRKATDIQSAAIYRCTTKNTHEVFYLVASDSHPGEYHTVSFDDARAGWSCSCPAMKPCKHIRAVSEVVKIRYEREHAAPVPVAVRDGEGYTAHIDMGDHREVVRAHDLPVLFPNGYRLVEKNDSDWQQWNERLARLEERLPVVAWDESDEPAHVEDSIRSGEFAYASCYGCGQRVRHEGYCYKCAA